MIGLDLDLSNDKPADWENTEVGPGWYKAVLADVVQNDEKYRFELVFTINHGGCANQKQTYFLSFPSHADNPDKAIQRVKMIAARLGLLTADDAGKAKTLNFLDAMGQEVFLQVETSPGKDGKKDFTGIAYSGIFPLNHPLDKLPKSFPDALKQFRTQGPGNTGGGATGGNTNGGGGGGNGGGSPAPNKTSPAAPARPARKTTSVDDL